MGLRRGKDGAACSEFASDPQSFKVGDRSAAAQMPQVGCPAEHLCDFANALLLHFGAGAAAIVGVIVRIQAHGERVGEVCQRMGRLQHLAQIQRLLVREILPKTDRRFPENFRRSLIERRGCSLGWSRETFRQQVASLFQNLKMPRLKNHGSPQVLSRNPQSTSGRQPGGECETPFPGPAATRSRSHPDELRQWPGPHQVPVRFRGLPLS